MTCRNKNKNDYALFDTYIRLIAQSDCSSKNFNLHAALIYKSNEGFRGPCFVYDKFLVTLGCE